MTRPRIATCSLAGCFGCHMSLLDIDELLLQLSEQVVFDRSPLTDVESLGRVDIGLVEGGLCNRDNVEQLLLFRRRCRVLVAVGACAITGGVPAMRNSLSPEDCLQAVYLEAPDLVDPQIPDDPELPPLLDQVRPLHEMVVVDYFLPGCPPSATVIGRFITELLAGKQPSIPAEEIRFD